MLLITGTIKPNNVSFLKISDEEKRLKQYIESMEWWIKESNVKKIVFCENSGFEFDKLKLEQLSSINGKKIEILQYKDESGFSGEYGKGYGEGQIIKYALENSDLLKGEDYFYKITGRIIIDNFNQINDRINRSSNYFNYNSIKNRNMVDTRFYRVNKHEYSNKLKNAYLNVRDNEGVFLEHVFYNEIIERKIISRCFPKYPRYIGYSGTSGDTYNESKSKLLIKDMLTKLKFFRVKGR